MGHGLMENRNGLIVDCEPTSATGTAGREAALAMTGRRRKTANGTVRGARVTRGADKCSDAEDFILALKALQVTPHLAINGAVSKTGKARQTAANGRTTRHKGYAISQRCCIPIEESFGWAKAIGGHRRQLHHGKRHDHRLRARCPLTGQVIRMSAPLLVRRGISTGGNRRRLPPAEPDAVYL